MSYLLIKGTPDEVQAQVDEKLMDDTDNRGWFLLGYPFATGKTLLETDTSPSKAESFGVMEVMQAMCSGDESGWKQWNP